MKQGVSPSGAPSKEAVNNKDTSKQAAKPTTKAQAPESAAKPTTKAQAPESTAKPETKKNEFQQGRRRKHKPRKPAANTQVEMNPAPEAVSVSLEKTSVEDLDTAPVTQVPLNTISEIVSVASAIEVIPTNDLSAQLESEMRALAEELKLDLATEQPAVIVEDNTEQPVVIVEEDKTSEVTKAPEEDNANSNSIAPNPGIFSRVSANMAAASRYFLNLLMLQPAHEANKRTVDAYAQVPKALLNGLKVTVDKFKPTSTAPSVPSCCGNSANEDLHTPSTVLTFAKVAAKDNDAKVDTQTAASPEQKSAPKAALS